MHEAIHNPTTAGRELVDRIFAIDLGGEHAVQQLLHFHDRAMDLVAESMRELSKRRHDSPLQAELWSRVRQRLRKLHDEFCRDCD